MINTARIAICSRRLYHMYKKTYTISSEIAEQSILHYENGILILNKPYGISFSQEISQGKKNDPLEVSLNTMLPFLKKKLNCDNIYNVRVPEKYISGVAIFCTKENVQKKLHEHLLRMRREKLQSDMYESVVVGTPLKEESSFEGFIKLEKSPTSAKVKKVGLVTSSSKNELRRGITKRVFITHKVLANSSHTAASLVEVSATKNSWHCIRAYFSTVLLAPILGDNIFGSCVKTVLGHNVKIDKFSSVADLPQKLSQELQTKLQLTSVKDVAVPLHLHLSKITINCFDRAGTCYTFSAPAPESFMWTCDRLGLLNAQNDEIRFTS